METKEPFMKIQFLFFSRLNIYTYSFIRLDMYKKHKGQQQTKKMNESFESFVGSTENKNCRR